MLTTVWTPSAVTGCAMPKKSRKPGMLRMFSSTAEAPPAADVAVPSTTTSAKIITMLCMKSDALSARKPPMTV